MSHLRPLTCLISLLLGTGLLPALACPGVSFEVVRPIDFGDIRFGPATHSGWISLQPDGAYLLSPGLAVSARSQLVSGEVRMIAPAGRQLLLTLEALPTAGLQSDFELTALRASVQGVALRQQGAWLSFQTPEPGAAGPHKMLFSIGADLLVKQVLHGAKRYTAVVGLRCVQIG